MDKQKRLILTRTREEARIATLRNQVPQMTSQKIGPRLNVSVAKNSAISRVNFPSGIRRRKKLVKMRLNPFLILLRKLI